MIKPKTKEYENISLLTKEIRNTLNLKPKDIINIKELIKTLNGKITYNKKYIDCIEKTNNTFTLHIANKTSEKVDKIKKIKLLGFLYIGMGYNTHKNMWDMVNENVVFIPDIKQREYAECFTLQLLIPDDDFIYITKKYTKNNKIYAQHIAKHYDVPYYTIIDKLIMLGYE